MDKPEERLAKMAEMLKVQSAPEHIAMVAKADALFDEISIATKKLKRRKKTLKNAPSTGDDSKVTNAEIAVTKAKAELASAEDKKNHWRGDFTDACQAPTTDTAKAQTAKPAPVVATGALGGNEWIEMARKRATEIIKRQREKDLYPNQMDIADEIARELRTKDIVGTDGKPLSGAYIKRRALKGLSSAIGKQLSTAIGRGK